MSNVYGGGGGGSASASSTIRYNVGPWKAVNVAQNANSNLGRVGTGASDNYWVAPRAGTITAISSDFTANITAGSATFQVSVDDVFATDANSVLVIDTNAPIRYKRQVLTTPIAVNAGQKVSMRLVASAAMLPTGTADPIVDFEFTEG